MEFNTKINGGHRGARKFWREMLPRIKYRNPSIPIQISRHNDRDGPSLVHIFTNTTSNPPSDLPTPPSGTPNAQTTLTPDTSTPTHTIDIKMLNESAILDKVIEKTGATVIEPTEEELEQMDEIREFKERSEKDRVEVREKLMKERREQELLKLARGEAAAAA
ncbi:hypothetical protein CC80DRAFT_461416 [Byssothecium circinans]|uniref:Ribosomal protein/NADH dehydrogenase domain-containing protein n=1 Tax=Byssothecium circinans TaxID=147558 RepID=A0A6A5UGR0_9PLEO|nr:hypothetical protein CC80DRAFT_461416 [Byssothecium circinans]